MPYGLRYTHPLDNLLRQASSVAVATGTPLDTYGAEHTYSGVWHRGLRIEGTDLDLVAEFAAPVTPLLAIIGNTNLDVASFVQGHNGSGFGGGTPDVDIEMGIPTLMPNGFYTSPWEAFAGAAKTHWRLHVVGNTEPIVIGQFVLVAVERGLTNTYLLRAFRPTEQGATESYRTPADVVLAYERATQVSLIDGSFVVNDTELEYLDRLVAASKFSARTFWMIPDTDVDDAWLVRMVNDDLPREKINTIGGKAWQVQFPIRMQARGLPHVDPDEIV